MTFDLMEDHPQAIHHGMADAGEDEQKTGLRLDLLIEYPESIAALAAYPEGRERTRFVRTALRIGTLEEIDTARKNRGAGAESLFTFQTWVWA